MALRGKPVGRGIGTGGGECPETHGVWIVSGPSAAPDDGNEWITCGASLAVFAAVLPHGARRAVFPSCKNIVNTGLQTLDIRLVVVSLRCNPYSYWGAENEQ